MSSVLHVYIDSSCVFLLQDPLRDWKQTENSLSHWPKFAKSLIGKSKTNEKKCQGYVKYRVVESPKLTIFNTSELINDNYSPGSSNYYFSPKVVLQYFRWRVSISFQKLLLDLLLRTQMEENLYKRYKNPCMKIRVAHNHDQSGKWLKRVSYFFHLPKSDDESDWESIHFASVFLFTSVIFIGSAVTRSLLINNTIFVDGRFLKNKQMLNPKHFAVCVQQ